MTWVAISVAVLALLILVGMSLVAYQVIDKARTQSSQVEKEVRELLTARVATLENRLLSHSWNEFANLQHVPNELDLANRAEEERISESYGERLDDLVDRIHENQGADLEGALFEGPTIG